MDDDAKKIFLSCLPDLPEDNLLKANYQILLDVYPDSEWTGICSALDAIADLVGTYLEKNNSLLSNLNVISEILYDIIGFRGSYDNYYNPDNSFIHKVLETNTGIPISLTLLHIEICRRLGIYMVPIGMPGHMLIGTLDEPDIFIDVYNKGIVKSASECKMLFHQILGQSAVWQSSYLLPMDNKDFIARMLRNLKHIYIHNQNHSSAVAMMNKLILLFPDDPIEHRDRGITNFYQNELQKSLIDLKRYAELGINYQESVNIDSIIQFLEKETGG